MVSKQKKKKCHIRMNKKDFLSLFSHIHKHSLSDTPTPTPKHHTHSYGQDSYYRLLFDQTKLTIKITLGLQVFEAKHVMKHKTK